MVKSSSIISVLRPELVALLASAEPRSSATTTTLSLPKNCTDCQHLLRPGTCAEPVAAGLLIASDGFGIVWPPTGHATTCAARHGKIIAPARPALSTNQGCSDRSLAIHILQSSDTG